MLVEAEELISTVIATNLFVIAAVLLPTLPGLITVLCVQHPTNRILILPGVILELALADMVYTKNYIPVLVGLPLLSVWAIQQPMMIMMSLPQPNMTI